LKPLDILQVNLDNYTLGSSFCRKNLTRGGVSIFVKNNLKFSQIELMQFCKEQDIKCCAVQLDTKLSKLCFLAIYRAPTDDFETFLNKLDSIMNYLYKPKTEFVICGDIDIGYLCASYRKQCLNSLLA
jgi:hypothetical protein